MADDNDKVIPADAYETEYMGVGEDIVHREKLTYPPLFKWFLAAAITGAMGFAGFEAIQAGDMVSIGILVATFPLMLFMMTMMATLRVTVTRDHLAVQYGPFGPKIPIDSIEHCEAEKYDFWKYGGYGIRYSLIENAWCYNMIGDKGKAVRIHYRNKSGRLKKLLIASRHHHLLADSINRARAELGHNVPAHLVPDEQELAVDDEVVFSEVMTNVPKNQSTESIDHQEAPAASTVNR